MLFISPPPFIKAKHILHNRYQDGFYVLLALGLQCCGKYFLNNLCFNGISLRQNKQFSKLLEMASRLIEKLQQKNP